MSNEGGRRSQAVEGQTGAGITIRTVFGCVNVLLLNGSDSLSSGLWSGQSGFWMQETHRVLILTGLPGSRCC